MRKFAIFSIIVGIALVIVGGFITVKAYNDGAFKQKNITKTIDIEEDYDNIYIDLDITNVELKKAEDNKSKIVCEEYEKLTHNAKVEDSTLKISATDERAWYNKYFFNFFSDIKITIYLTEDSYNEFNFKLATGNLLSEEILNVNKIDLNLSTGNIRLANITSEEIKINESTGNVLVSELNVNNLNVTCSTGNIKVVNVISDKMNLKCSVGNINFDSSDASYIEAYTSTGNITGNLLTGKTFTATSDTGKVNVPSTTGNPCILKTSTGNIKITIKE